MLNRRQFTFFGAALSAFAQSPQPQQTAPPAQVQPQIDWHDIRKFTLEGLAYADRKAPYDRLPARAEGVVPPQVWGLSHHSAGALVRFNADTPLLRARWTRIHKGLAGTNMTAIAASGLDLYTRPLDAAEPWRWLGVGRPVAEDLTTDAPLVTGMPAGPREFMLYLPLYNGVTSVEIGVAKGASITPAAPRPASRIRPIVFYGTSITHGASASRAGMCHVAMLGRTFDRPVINLGFSGNGRMETEVVKLVAEIDAAAFVLDCLPNMDSKQVTERTEPGVKILRTAHPDTPIVLVEDRFYPDGFLIASRREHNQANHAALRAAYERLREAKVTNLGYVEGAALLDANGEDTIDGSHPTDLGFLHQAQALERALRPLLK